MTWELCDVKRERGYLGVMAGVYTLFTDREIPCELRDDNHLTNGPEKKNLRVRICVLGDEQGLLSVKVRPLQSNHILQFSQPVCSKTKDLPTSMQNRIGMWIRSGEQKTC
jgi:hypothetical protein